MKSFPLPAVRAEDLAPLLEEEIGHWERQLFWDFRSTASLIKRYVKGRCLNGSVLEDASGELIGYEYHVSDPPVGYIGDLYVKDSCVSAEAYSMLLATALESLEGNPQVRRIECQLFPFNFDTSQVFARRGFSLKDRYFLSLRVESVDPKSPLDKEPDRFRLIPWKSDLLSAVAEVIYDSYRSSPDREICNDYSSLRGCRRFLQNLIGGPGCGAFEEGACLLAIDQKAEVCGVLLASLIHRASAMIPQISVKRSCQGQGLGTLMMSSFLRKARARGWERISLSASELNADALRLYRKLGFRRHMSFRAFIRDASDTC